MHPFSSRLAQLDDLGRLHALMNRSIATLQSGFLSSEQVAASHKVMGLDTQLVRDQTYFLVEEQTTIVGCGGWSFRATLYGGDESIVAREPARLDPATDAAKVRAMYTHPDHARRGIGSIILDLCEGAARSSGFSTVELMATAAGVPLYEKRGYAAVDSLIYAEIECVRVPLLRMRKLL